MTVSIVLGAPTKFSLSSSGDALLDRYIKVTVRLEDQFSNLVSTGTSQVRVEATGSVRGETVVDLEAGVGSLYLTSSVAEAATVFLTAVQGVSYDTSSTLSIAFSAGASLNQSAS